MYLLIDLEILNVGGEPATFVTDCRSEVLDINVCNSLMSIKVRDWIIYKS